MLRQIRNWTVGIVAVSLFLVAALYYPVKWVSEWRAKDAHYNEVSTYVDRVEPVVARLAFDMANSHGCLSDRDRGELIARLNNLDVHAKDIVFLGVPNLDKDTYGKFTDDTISRIGFHCKDEVWRKYNIDSWNGGEEYRRLLNQEVDPYRDIFEMNQLINRLSWNYAGVLWEKSFGSKSRYTMEELAKDKTEYEELKPQLEELIAKHVK